MQGKRKSIYPPEYMVNRLKKLLGKKRFVHSVQTSKIAASLASKYGVSRKKAAVAGLLHDCAKDYPRKEMKKYLKTKRESREILKCPATWHCFYGESVAGSVFGVRNAEITAAIKYHTTGHENMGPLAKVIYVADFIEPSRKYRGSENVRRKISTGKSSLDGLV